MTNNNCEEYIVKMNMYLDGELPVSQIAGLMAHINTCTSCKRQFEWLKVLAFETRSLKDTEPDMLHESIMQHVRDNTEKKKRKLKESSIYAIAAVAATLVIIFTGASYLLNNTYVFGNPWGFGKAAGSARSDTYLAGQNENAAAVPQNPTGDTAPKSALQSPPPDEGVFALPPDITINGKYAFYIAAQGIVPEQLMLYSKVSYEEGNLTFIYVPAGEKNKVRQTLLNEGLKIYNTLQGLPDAAPDASEGLVMIVTK